MPADILAVTAGTCIAAAPLVIAVFAPRDTDANHHTIDDYKPQPTKPNPAPHIQPARQPGRWTHLDQQTTTDILPPAPPGTHAGGSPIYRQTYVDHLFAGFDAAAVAAQVLRDLGEQARKAVTS
ncbi:hypothetical protein AB0J77_14530 [Micromonospora tulbaghiae]|uniref:hypothetical protein n=1 Tax=Micromonospora tulbaghiae TaxID=479978 RepID=UPI0034210A70